MDLHVVQRVALISVSDTTAFYVTIVSQKKEIFRYFDERSIIIYILDKGPQKNVENIS